MSLLFRRQFISQQRLNYGHCHLIVSYRGLSQLTNAKHHQFKCNNYNPHKLTSNPASLTYLRMQKRHLSVPSPASVNLMMKGLFAYLVLYISYKFFAKREDRGPRLEIIENHLFSPFHISSILSLIYPKLLGIFQR